MSAILKMVNVDVQFINREIQSHPAWLGRVSGLKAEKMLRGPTKPFTYLLRAGESDENDIVDYYVTYKDRDGTIRHQPVVITTTQEGWYFENGGGGGPFSDDVSINDVLHHILHCQEGESTPFINFER